MFYFDYINKKKILKSGYLNGLNHFFTTREIILTSKDDSLQETIRKNKKDVCKYLNMKPENLIHPSQTHSANIETAIPGKNTYPETDAIILSNCEQAVYLNFADCTPVILYDKKKHIAAISHAGWRGTAQNIAVKTVHKMAEQHNCNVNDITAVIGPAISICCYDIGDEVYNALKNSVKENVGLFHVRSGKTYADLKAINQRQLEEAGVAAIDVCPYCTSCNNDLFFSYRKENATTDRHSAVIKL